MIHLASDFIHSSITVSLPSHRYVLSSAWPQLLKFNIAKVSSWI
jgi:hypothetical protein